MRLVSPAACAASLVSLLMLAPSGPAGAAEAEDELEKLIEDASSESSLDDWADEEAERPPTFPRLEHHGYFRFRGDLFWRGHLGTVVPGDPNSGTSAIPAPLTENVANNDSSNNFLDEVGSQDAKTLATANIRFRYSPTFHISPTLRIHATFDVLDNLVMGSTPDFAGNLRRPDVPLSMFAQSQAPPEAGVNGFRDGIRVKEAYADWQPAFLLRVGRMRSHWGLGVLANGGQCLDCDYGDYADRAMLLFKMYGVYIAPMWDFVYSGATTDDPADFFGQPKDLGQDDDVKQWVLAIFQRPVSQAEKDKREVDLREHLKPAFDWGLYTVFRKQDMALKRESWEGFRDQGFDAMYHRAELVPRDAWAVIPDLWLRYEQRFDYFSGIRFELEAVGVVGEVDRVTDDASAGTPGRTVQQFGLAAELQYDWHQLGFGLDTGFASGDSAKGFGVEDQHQLSEPDGTPNETVTAFKFDRDYHIDLLLFREVIGTVTNAVYVKPYVVYDIFDSVEESLGARIDLLYARAIEPRATPGDDGNLGFEADLRLFYEDKGTFNLDIESGFLFPGSAFDYVDASGSTVESAKFAFTVQTRLTLQF